MTDTSPIRPVRYWDGTPVPFITAWSKEAVPPQPLAVIEGRGGVGLGFRDEISHIDRRYGALWMRMPATRGGQPELERVHALRQPQAMSRLLCQVCGGPTVGSRLDERTLFLAASADGRPIGEGEVTASPPVHAVCARLAVEHCRPLRRGWTAALVQYVPIWGVAGLVYDPVTLTPFPRSSSRTGLHDIAFTDTVRLRCTLAARLLVTLEGVTPVTDLDALADEETAVIRAVR
ncbi:hypothetical protein [Streptomyces achromogenes]|uniref:hypothetical protein n=1 Tax=Streptomyces achromogenes TaxID=67255 RepID=UPI003415B701